jgi:hypothetical protein
LNQSEKGKMKKIKSKIRAFTLLFPAICFSFVTLFAQTNPHAVSPPAAKDFTGILSFLSSDWMEGREAGTRGGFIAAGYIASMMQLYGLSPFGDPDKDNEPGSPHNINKTYFQNFHMIRCRVEKSSLALIRHSPDGESAILFSPGIDYQVDPVPFGSEAEVPVVFTGYGIEAPGKGYDEYKGMGVSNRIVVVLDGYPGHSDTTSPSWKKLGKSFEEEYATIKQKLRIAEKHGALAMVIVDPVMVNNPINSSLTENTEDDNFRHFLPGDTGKVKIPCFRMGADAARLLFKDTGIELPGFEKKAAQDLLPSSRVVQEKKLRFSVAVKSEALIIQNVLGVIHGSDTTRNIIVGGHYDHLGVRKGEIYNGADDNASGVAGMLALAKVWADRTQKPSCNIIFAAWTGEEKGKLGSTYFARHSPIVPDRLSLVINLDMISRSAPEDTAAKQLSIGTRTINKDLRNLAKTINTRLEHPFILELWDVTGASGSDYRPFADRKVPIITFHAGFPNEYHTPLDDFVRVDLAKMEKILKIVNDCLMETLDNPPMR